MGILTIEYNKDVGIVTSDGKLEEQAKNIIDIYHNYNKMDKHVLVSNCLMITYFRVLVKQGKINHKDIMFKYGMELILVDINGRLSNFPDGFDDMWDKYLDILVD